VLDFSVGGPDQVGLRLIGYDSDKGQIRDSARVATLDCKLEFQAFGIGRNFSLCASLAQCNERHRSRAKRKHLRRLLAFDQRMHRRHDVAEQLELAHLAVTILVGAAFERPRERPA